MYACMVRNEPYDEKRLAKDMGIEIVKRAKA
jgi:hypothetical protein